MLSSVVDISNACGLLMASSAPFMDKHFFTCMCVKTKHSLHRLTSQSTTSTSTLVKHSLHADYKHAWRQELLKQRSHLPIHGIHCGLPATRLMVPECGASQAMHGCGAVDFAKPSNSPQSHHAVQSPAACQQHLKHVPSTKSESDSRGHYCLVRSS